MKTHLGHYEIVSELGRGGMGVVYKGYEPALGRNVAIKELSPSLAHDQNLVERFLREARSMAALNDPHIIQIYFIGQEDEQPFFVMEFVEGESLSQILKREKKIGVADALKIIHQTAQGLATAHDKGVVHRDIKPGNLMVTPKGQVKIADFGIALASTDFSQKLTSTGEFVGTPGYLSPEVCMAKPVDQRSDIFSLGIVLYEMLSGDTPFQDESPLGLMLEVVKAEIPDIREINKEVDAQTAAILTRMVAKDPADRFQSCHDLAAALEAHPQVAKGGTITLAAPKPAPADATMVGAPTPASQQARRMPTPPPNVSKTGVGTAASAAPVSPPAAPAAAVDGNAPTAAGANATRPSVLAKSRKQGRGPMLPLAIAAVLVLGIVGGAFAFRGPLTDLFKGYVDGFSGSAYEDGVAAGQASNPVGVSQAGTLSDGSNDGATDAASGNSGDGLTEAERSAVIEADQGDAGQSAAGFVVDGIEDGAGNTAVAQSPTTGQSNGMPNAAQVEAATRTGLADSSSVSGAVPGNTSANGVVSSVVAANAATQNASAATQSAPPKNLASRTKPQAIAPPRNPRIAVVALGDSAVTAPAAQRIESALSRDGFDLVDTELLEGVAEHARAGNLARLMSRFAQRRDVDVLVVVKAEPIGTQELQYYGRSSTLYSAYLSV
ncbi:MAG: protein kinase, partial [Xanthomonadales bacterium]|nr:protein kinase [Xanthomonadales bacterium]